jgi:hypothetical protein
VAFDDSKQKRCQKEKEKGVRPEWRLDKAHNFLGQGFASLRIRGGSEDDLARNPFHLLGRLPKFSLVCDGLLQDRKLGRTKAVGHRLLSDLSRPLISASPRSSYGS